MTTHDHALNELAKHRETCTYELPEHCLPLPFIPPDDVVPSGVGECKQVVAYATCVLELTTGTVNYSVAHPCHHELNSDESEQMIAQAVKA